MRVGVVAGRHEDRLGRERLDGGQQLVLPGRDERLVAASGRQRPVVLRARGGARAGLATGSGARVVRGLVRRRVAEGRIGVEDRLRAVAVVHVPVDDRDPLRNASRPQPRHGDRHVVEQAEAAAPPSRRVVSGWPNDGERHRCGTGPGRERGLEGGAGSEPCGAK